MITCECVPSAPVVALIQITPRSTCLNKNTNTRSENSQVKLCKAKIPLRTYINKPFLSPFNYAKF